MQPGVVWFCFLCHHPQDLLEISYPVRIGNSVAFFWATLRKATAKYFYPLYVRLGSFSVFNSNHDVDPRAIILRHRESSQISKCKLTVL